MASIEVYRGAGDQPGAPIIEPLLSDAALAIRGRAEMDQHGQQSQRADLEILFRAGLQPGLLLELDDMARETPMRAKVTGVSVRLDAGRIDCTLTTEEPQEPQT